MVSHPGARLLKRDSAFLHSYHYTILCKVDNQRLIKVHLVETRFHDDLVTIHPQLPEPLGV
jgi:hypothetical protein